MSNSTAKIPTFFKTPFFPAYWRQAAKEMKQLRIMVVAALFIALDIVLGLVVIPVGENLRIGFSFFATSLLSLVCGPVVGIIAGFIRDVLGFLINPSGGFFFGYTITAMLAGLLYALFFYRTRITVLRIFLCKLSVNLFLNVLLGCVWSAILMGKGYYYYFVKSLIKNTLLLPVEVILLVLFLQLMLPILAKLRLVPEQPTRRIPFF